VQWVCGSFIGLLESSAPAKEGYFNAGNSSTSAKFEGGSAMGMTIVYVVVSLVVCIAYFTAVDHFLMESQGLDYWYLFRK
jgi:hypothetical protein